jgi:hypothetical protein
MKKFLFVCVIMFIVNIGCKKTDFDGSAPCGCSFSEGPLLLVTIKNSEGTDMLNVNNAGAYSREKIQVYRKDAAGKETPAAFFLRAPATYGAEKIASYQLSITVLNHLQQQADNVFYLKLGDGKPYEFNVEVDQTTGQINKLFIDKKEVKKSTASVNLPLYNLTI